MWGADGVAGENALALKMATIARGRKGEGRRGLRTVRLRLEPGRQEKAQEPGRQRTKRCLMSRDLTLGNACGCCVVLSSVCYRLCRQYDLTLGDIYIFFSDGFS